MRLPALLLLAAIYAPAQGPLMKSILPKYNYATMNLIETAEAMSADAYNFRLTPAQRPFGECEHNIQMNWGLCARIEGKAADPKPPASSSKADLVVALKESFAFCDVAFDSMTDEKALEPAEVGGRQVLPADTMISLLINWNEHYGNLVGYLRLKGITSPTTARTMKKK